MAFRDYLVAQGLSPKTIRIYERKVCAFVEWCVQEGVDPFAITAIEVAAMADTFPHTSSSRRQLRSALAYWWEMTGRDRPPVKAIRVPKKPEYHNRALSREDARLLVKRATGWHPEGTAVLLGMYLALRASEIAAARFDRFSDDFQWYTVLGKGDRTHTLPVHHALAAEVRWVANRPHNGWLFPGSKGREYVTPMTVWNWVKRVSEAAGLERVEPHQLRHTAITTANDATGDLRTVAEFARHSRIETTRLYTRVSDEQLRRVVEAIDYFDEAGGGVMVH